MFKIIVALLMISFQTYAASNVIDPDKDLDQAVPFELLNEEGKRKALEDRNKVQIYGFSLLLGISLGFSIFGIFVLIRKGKMNFLFKDRYCYNRLRDGDPIIFLISHTVVTSYEIDNPRTRRSLARALQRHNLVVLTLMVQRKIEEHSLQHLIINYIAKLDFQEPFWMNECNDPVDVLDIRFLAIQKSFNSLKKFLSENYKEYEKLEKSLNEYMSKGTIKLKM